MEPYIFDSINMGRFDSQGARHRTPHEHDFGSLTYIFYGLTDKITVGLLPAFEFKHPANEKSSSTIGANDLSVQASLSLTDFDDGDWLPATSLVLSETLPTGKYDRLGERSSDGLGTGAHASTVSIFSQYYFWMPNGRILRTRLDISRSWSKDAVIHDTSVYDTPSGFRGRAKPGTSNLFDLAFEYSLTKNWVVAADILYESGSSTNVAGKYPSPNDASGGPIDFQSRSGPHKTYGLVPAVEYCWSGDAGIIVGAKFVAGGSNTTAAIIPIMAINLGF